MVWGDTLKRLLQTLLVVDQPNILLHNGVNQRHVFRLSFDDLVIDRDGTTIQQPELCLFQKAIILSFIQTHVAEEDIGLIGNQIVQRNLWGQQEASKCKRTRRDDPMTALPTFRTCLTPKMAEAVERSSVSVAPASRYSWSVKTRFVHGWTSTLMPRSWTNVLTWAGVKGARRSQWLYTSRTIPILLERAVMVEPTLPRLGLGTGRSACQALLPVRTIIAKHRHELWAYSQNE